MSTAFDIFKNQTFLFLIDNLTHVLQTRCQTWRHRVRNVSPRLVMSDQEALVSLQRTSLDVTGRGRPCRWSSGCQTTNTLDTGQLSAYLHDPSKLHKTKDETWRRLPTRVISRPPRASGGQHSTPWASPLTVCPLAPCPVDNGPFWGLFTDHHGHLTPALTWCQMEVFGEVRRAPHARSLTRAGLYKHNSVHVST